MPQSKKRAVSAKKKNSRESVQSKSARTAVKEPKMTARQQRTGDDLAAQLVPPILVIVALFIVICFISAEATGFFGSWLSSVLYGLFSNAAFMIPVLIAIIAAFWKRDYEEYNLRNKTIFAGVCLLCVSALMQYNGPDTFKLNELWESGVLREGGGVIGGYIGQAMLKSIGKVGMLLVSISLLVIFGLFLFGLTPHAVRIWVAFKLNEHNERLKAERAEAQARRVYLNKPQLEAQNAPQTAAAAPAQTRRGRAQAADEMVNGKEKHAYIYEGDDGGEGKVKPVDYNAGPTSDKQITINDKEADAGVVDAKVFDAVLKQNEQNPPVDEDTPPFDLPTGGASDAKAETGERIKPLGTVKHIKKRTDIPETEGEVPKSAKTSDALGLHEIFADDDAVGLDIIRKFSETQRDGMGYVSSDGSAPESAALSVAPEAAEAELTLNVKRGAAVPSSAPGTGSAQKTEAKAEPHKYEFPPVTLLRVEPAPKNTDVSEELHTNAVKLVETLRSFKVRTKIVNVSRGPTITRYELSPDEGIRVRSIANLVDDIALSLATTGVRIEAPIPGKAAVGIEVPNRIVATVYARELIEKAQFAQAQSKLTVSLGMDVAGEPIYIDIAKMPHLLIAGATGMGKSVCINSMIISLLYKASPDEVKLILVDPKKVELNVYNGLPHLLVPVVSDPKKAAGSLHWAVTEMERRFELIESTGARDIKSYNNATKDDPEKEFMPHVVIIIDELADLMMTAPDDVEESICRLAQKARAAGMHLIIGTQRPSVDVITGLIKANVPSRIAFTVASQTDSRVVIDISGAEKLIGRGDMLYAPVGCVKPIRVQGAFVSEQEVEAVVGFIKQRTGESTYDSAVIDTIEREAERCVTPKKSGMYGADDADEGVDPMLKPAIELAVESGKIATSLIQRRLSLGYGRAAKLIDKMEQMGIVSAPEGKNPRRVLITRQQYMEMVVNRSEELQ
jgi:DNA segregation ATPase FtsK/SpoIIIE and related proteins